MTKLTIALLAAVSFAGADFHVQKGEKLLYGLKCKNGKEMGLVLGKGSSYLQYRYGKANKVEFEYPKNKKGSFKQFIYSGYLRAGAGNAGLDLQYLRFKNSNTLYVVYDEYSQDNTRDYGIQVFKNGKLLNRVKCNFHKGSLSDVSDLPVKKDDKTEFVAEMSEEVTEKSIEDCYKKALSTWDNANCNYKAYDFYSKKLNAAYKKLIHKLPKEEQDRLKKAQKAWIKYRDLECDFEAYEMRGGSYENILRYGCKIKLTKDRVKDFTAN